MFAVVRVLFLCLFLSLFAEAQVRTLAVYPGSVHSLDGMVTNTLERELQRLLAPAGIDIVWQPAEGANGQAFESVVVGAFSGNCSVEEATNSHASPPKSMVLGEAIVNPGGKILPYFRVDCDRVIRLLDPMLGRLSPPLRRGIFGRALARVVAHEIYHIVAQSTDHQSSGVAKASFLLEDLAAARFDFSSASLERLKTKESRTVPFVPLSGALLPPE